MPSFQTILYELHDMLIDPSGLPPETAKALGARLEGRQP